MNVVQNELYLSNKCLNYVKYSIGNYNIYYKILILIYINIQSRCNYPCADSQVSQPVANTKVIQKLISFSKRMLSAIRFLLGGRQG